MMPRTLSEIEDELAARFISTEYLPLHIERTIDLENFAQAIGEFLAPYVKQLEDLGDILNNESLLRTFLLAKGMYLSGDENLAKLQLIAENRYRIMLERGTMQMVSELRRLCVDKDPGSETNIEYRDIESNGWFIERTSPLYRDSNISLNTCYLEIKDLIIFNLKNLSNRYSDNDIKEIVKRFFEPKHIRSLYNFIT